MLISIPLGIRKAVKDGTSFDTWTSGVIIAAYAIPGFLFAILLLVLVCGGVYYQIFPLRGLTSDNFDSLAPSGKVLDYFWHIALPVLASTIRRFATLTLLTKNSFLDEIKKHYVMTARAKGLSRTPGSVRACVPQRHADRDRGFPAVFFGVSLAARSSSRRFSRLDGWGVWGSRPRWRGIIRSCFGTLYIFGLIGLVVGILSDLMYVLVDPRIDFERGKADGFVPLNQRRWSNFKRNRRAYWSLWIFAVLFGCRCLPSLWPTTSRSSCNIAANYYTPIFNFYPETAFGGDFQTEAVYRDPEVKCLIVPGGLEDCFDDPDALSKMQLTASQRGGDRQRLVCLAADSLFFNTAVDRPGAAPCPPTRKTCWARTAPNAMCLRG